ncbi:hypothetical protein [Neolewinella xylanilytica]|uniref:hypothetical protein n=1 Tax=Neolewinella xylanilytica TaxID=1514080 RepID=UPI0011B0D4E2|nr:hypothetical protein [Neolewinella xylanilytica]
MHYTDQAVGLLVGLLDAVGATNITLTHWEIQITSPRIIQIPEYIQANRLDRKGGRSWGIEIGEGGTVNGMRIGKQASPRSFNLYKNGTTLERRNRQYIASRVVADGIATMQDKPKLARLELHIKSKEFNKLTYHDSFGELQPVTLQSLLDPSVRLAIFRQEVMSAFIFRKRIGKDRYATAQFFDWEAIERHYARLHGYSAGNHTTAARTPLKARSSDATYGAKQTIKMLSKDGQPGSYLIRGLQKHIERIVRETILANASIRCPTERLSQAGSKSTTNLNGDLEAICYPEGLTELSEELSISLPDIIAHTIAANYGISEYVAKKYRGVV